jgi:hypothetical protein
VPAFAQSHVDRQVAPLARSGVKVDDATIAVKLLQARHPLAMGAIAIGGALAAALIVLWLQYGT